MPEFTQKIEIPTFKSLKKIRNMRTYRDLLAYQESYDLAMKIFQVTKHFPPEEKYSLIDQVRRSSRSVCTNIVEAYRRKRYKDYFISKLNDSETENSETQVWLDFSLDCKYLKEEDYVLLTNLNNEVGKLIWYMINNPEKFT